MGNIRHSQQTTADGIHTVAAYIYADEAARLAATGFTTDDLYKIAYQTSTDTLWVLIDTSPITWTELASGSSQQLNKVEIAIIKDSSGTINVGQAVHGVVWDDVNDRASVELAKADSTSTLPCGGICTVQATDSSEGKAMLLGILHAFDTSLLTLNAPVYLSATTAGALTTTPPPGPYVTQPLGVCLKSDASDGHMGVNVLGYRAYDYTNTPEALGTAATGTRNLASPSDHVHVMPKLDDLNAPDDNTDLDASTGQHGLLLKLGGGSTNFLRADGTWAEPPGSAVGRLFFPCPDYDSNTADYRTRAVGATAEQRFNFQIPSDFGTLVSVELCGMVSAGAAGSGKDIDLASDYAAVGEIYNQHSESDTGTTYDFTGLTYMWARIDLSPVFSALGAGDQCGVLVDHNGIGGTINYFGIILEYNKS